MRAYESHPLADLFPLIEGADFAALAADIGAYGIRQPICLWQGRILDGRNRYRAAQSIDHEFLDSDFRAYVPEIEGDPLAYVLSQNLNRRHLDDRQRASIAGKIANLGRGRPAAAARDDEGSADGARDPAPALNPPDGGFIRRDGGDPPDGRDDAVAHDGDDDGADAEGYVETVAAAPVTVEQAAASMHVAARQVERARVVHAHGVPEVREALDRGLLPVATAERLARLPEADQREALRRAKADDKKQRRAERERELGERQCALPQRRYGVILADPEWRYEPWSRESGMDRAADNHYPTSPTEAICRRDVPSIAADDCALFLWATVPMLLDALRVMQAWGFVYRSHYVWDKGSAGTGYWGRNRHELLLIGTRGEVPCPAPGTQCESVIVAPAGAHSEKPECVLDTIERYFPSLPKIELNRRGPPRPGWDAWGNESEAKPDGEEAAPGAAGGVDRAGSRAAGGQCPDCAGAASATVSCPRPAAPPIDPEEPPGPTVARTEGAADGGSGGTDARPSAARPPSPAGADGDPWDALDIPNFLRRGPSAETAIEQHNSEVSG